jgi:hypothetical protein
MSSFTLGGIDFATFHMSVEGPMDFWGTASNALTPEGLPGTDTILFSSAVPSPVEYVFKCLIRVPAGAAASPFLPWFPPPWVYPVPTTPEAITLQSCLDAAYSALGGVDPATGIQRNSVDRLLVYWPTSRGRWCRWDGLPLKVQWLNTMTARTAIRFLCQPIMVATAPTVVTL